MPNHAKATKSGRDRRMINGLRKHRQLIGGNFHTRVRSVDELIALFQEHLDALTEVAEREAAWRAAIARETRLEKGIKALMAQIKPLIEGSMGIDSSALRDFGLKPYARRKPTTATMKAAIEQRRATRKLRGTMGKRQRKRMKAKGSGR
jgi:hypothetical protein